MLLLKFLIEREKYKKMERKKYNFDKERNTEKRKGAGSTLYRRCERGKRVIRDWS